MLFFLNKIKSEPNGKDSVDETNVSTRKTKKRRTIEKNLDAANKNGLGFEPDEILGASEIDGVILFRIKVKDSDVWKIVKAKIAHAACPELVMDFYEKHIILNGEPLNRNN